VREAGNGEGKKQQQIPDRMTNKGTGNGKAKATADSLRMTNRGTGDGKAKATADP